MLAMAASTSPRLVLSFSFLSRHRGLFFLLVFLAFVSSVFVLLSSTSKLYIHTSQTRLHINQLLDLSKSNIPMHPQEIVKGEISQRCVNCSRVTSKEPAAQHENVTSIGFQAPAQVSVTHISRADHPIVDSAEPHNKNHDVFHSRSLFMKDYKEMNKSFKIYAYPHKKNDPFANILLPVDSAPGGNYASESYFKKALFKSRFLTSDPSKAHLFYLPFSIASLRNDPRVGVEGIKDFIRDYISNISRNYPFWNRTGGADHFYVACHSVGRTAMEKAVQVKQNAIQVVCSSSYFLAGYVSHKDASIPQIWPREGRAPTQSPADRKKLAFYAGAMNSRVREFLVKNWENDDDISVHQSRLETPYSEALLGSKFCIHAKGFEINTARIGDALYYGCVPVILADHYDLPYADVLNWNSFAVILLTSDIPMLKKILQGISNAEYLKLQRNVMRVQMHFQWNNVPVDYDAFHMVMYELWLRRSHVRISFI